MSARDLLVRARQLIQRGATGAMVIVPLAVAAEARASSVPFTYGGGTPSQSATGGYFLGHAEGGLVGGGSGVAMNSDTVMDVMPPPFSSPPPYVPAQLVYEKGGSVSFDWSGGFGTGTTDMTTDSLLVTYSLNLASILSDTGHTDFGDVSWGLRADVYSSAVVDSDYLMAEFATGGSALGPVSETTTTTAFTVNAQPLFWSVHLELGWDMPTVPDPILGNGAKMAKYGDDRLSANSMISLAMISQGGGGPAGIAVPLPPAAWMGGALLAGVMAQGAWRRRKYGQRVGG